MSLNEPSVDFHLKNQEATFRVPYELLRKNIKDIQKLDEKQFRKMDELLVSFKNCKGDKKVKLRQMLTAMKQYDKKLRSKYEYEQELLARIKARLSKLNELKQTKERVKNDKEHRDDILNREKLRDWYRDQTNLLLVDYLLRNHTSLEDNPGLSLLRDLDFGKLIDTDVLLRSNHISSSIVQNHDLSLLVSWMQENKTYLKKNKSSLEFETRLQEYIECIKRDEITRALDVFKTHLFVFTKTNFKEIRLASGLLILHGNRLNTDPNMKKYCDLLSDDRYRYLSNLFLEIYYKMHGIPHKDPLLIYLSLGISVLKTKSCHCSSKQTGSSHFEDLLKRKIEYNTDSNHTITSNCPVCSPELSQLCQDLPNSHNVESFLFDNPVMLPNGNIFDKAKLLAFSSGLEGMNENDVKDPITSEMFKTTDLVNMYPT